jgi:hypothetical protein
MKRVRLLMLSANPSFSMTETLSRLRVDIEARDVEEKINSAALGDSFDVVSKTAVRAGDLITYLLEHKPEILHLSAHGTKDGIVLDSTSGEADIMPAETLASIVAQMTEHLRLVVLTACSSLDVARKVGQHVEFVVAMGHEVIDTEAIKFSTTFYNALAYGKNLATAFELGRARMAPGQTAIPQLIAKPGTAAAACFTIDATQPAEIVTIRSALQQFRRSNTRTQKRIVTESFIYLLTLAILIGGSILGALPPIVTMLAVLPLLWLIFNCAMRFHNATACDTDSTRLEAQILFSGRDGAVKMLRQTWCTELKDFVPPQWQSS